MAPRSGRYSVANTFAERVFQYLEDNRPSDAQADFSSPLPKKQKPVKPKAAGPQTLPARSNTVESSDFYSQSEASSYEARSHGAEEVALGAGRREREAAAAVILSLQDSTPDAQQEKSSFCHGCVAEEEKEWIKVVDADLD
ncbi:uncharacterized protein ColSpa_11535 [Colletotrichum spaethianum]|uniref:Uncharacterized protein n=1 Tax=Colletotrichum spaethianum TaxID=700344 RepID=A0AA37PFR2_9PEZI|nr:uncharacterized protein ColSpa_11535 [Colletotrichum spaethianum]GKT51354.1 hypothetical protein ColSpa_11535 [Colletotrichum spaethianum]